MRHNELWQGCVGYWQNRFVHHNILVIGYTAWLGYLNDGQGMVVCEIPDAIPRFIDWTIDSVPFKPTFIPYSETGAYLQALNLENSAVTSLLTTIATYNPAQTIVALVIGNGEIDINLLDHLAISPADCYAQVCRRWSEFRCC